jgi:hypothetical protein
MRRFLIYLAFIPILVQAQVPQSARSDRDTTLPRRTQQLSGLVKDLRGSTDQDRERITEGYAHDRLLEIRRIVQDQVLETLSKREEAKDVRDAVIALLGPYESHGGVFAYSARLRGVETMVVGYSLSYGAMVISNAAVSIQGYRKGLVWEFVADAGTDKDNYDLALVPVDSPRSNEAWYLAHGRAHTGGNPQESPHLISFDGFEFKKLWVPDHGTGMYFGEFKISKDSIVLTYNLGGGMGPRMRDTVLLTIGGATASTSNEMQQQ